MELAVIGIDALDPDLLERWRDDLHHLPSLADSGGFGTMKSSYPPLSIPAWPTLYTGKQGGKHGVYGFTKPQTDGYDRDPVNFDDVRAESLWEILDDAGLSCGVANVPLTYPPSDLDQGFVLSGWPSPQNADICSDENVLAALEDDLGTDYEPSPFPLTFEFDELDNEDLFEQIRDGMWHHANAFQQLLQRHDLDVFFCTFMAVDIASHNFAWDEDRLKRTYQEQDEALGQVLDLLPTGTDVVVVSDHGHGARSEYSFHVNEWLASEGLLQKGSSQSSILERLGVTQQNYVRAKNLLGLGNVHNLFPQAVYNFLTDAVPRGDDSSGLDAESVVWEETAAYSTEGMEIFINDTSKPRGSVTNVAEIQEQIVEGLNDLTYPDSDKPLCETTLMKDELFEGPYVDEGPDVVFVPSDMECNAPTALNDGNLFSSDRWGEHRQYGILLTNGPSFENDFEAEPCCLYDFLPTVLAALDIDIPDNVDGVVLKERFAGTVDASFRPSKDETDISRMYNKTEANDVREQLEGLGYLE